MQAITKRTADCAGRNTMGRHRAKTKIAHERGVDEREAAEELVRPVDARRRRRRPMVRRARRLVDRLAWTCPGPRWWSFAAAAAAARSIYE